MRFSKNKDLNNKAVEFVKAYRKLKTEALSLDKYNQVYVKKYLEKLEYNTYLACHLLEGLNLESYNSVIDLGGGIGFNTAFFSFIGCKNVVYFDVDKISTRDAKTINASLGLTNIEYYSTGFEDLIKIDLSQSLVCSRDVIEHIYDLPAFFEITQPAKLNRHNTAAVLNSVFRKKEFKNIHHNAEHIGATSEIKKQRDSTSAYFDLRKTIIADIVPQKTEAELLQLTKATRGLIKADIEQFLFSSKLPLFHSAVLHSNTCDPNTGNWAERTLSFANYKLLAQAMPLKFRLVKYNEFDGNFLKKGALRFLNFALRISKNERLCPSFSVEY
jgi:2-polyprenyl-3-methyl-5-hydroxy-6-metoxy-1,4-benzoquinol methylase